MLVQPGPRPIRRTPDRTRDGRTRGWPRLLMATTLALSMLAASRPAAARPGGRAPSTEEQSLFAEGLRLYQAGDGRGAERAFKAGFAVAHDSAFLVRMGEAEELAGAPREAAESYARYVRENPDASDREDIEARLRRLAPAGPAPTTNTDVPGEMARPGEPTPPTGMAPAAPPTPPAQPAPGAAPTTPAPSSALAAPRPGPPASRGPSAQARDDEELRALIDENAPQRSRLNVAAWVAAGTTVALAGVAAFFAAKASEKGSDVNYLQDNFDGTTGVPLEYATVAARYEADVRDGKRDDRLATGFAIGAGVTALTSAALFILDSVRGHGDATDGSRHARLVPMNALSAEPQTRPQGVSLRWTF